MDWWRWWCIDHTGLNPFAYSGSSRGGHRCQMLLLLLQVDDKMKLAHVHAREDTIDLDVTCSGTSWRGMMVFARYAQWLQRNDDTHKSAHQRRDSGELVEMGAAGGQGRLGERERWRRQNGEWRPTWTWTCVCSGAVGWSGRERWWWWWWWTLASGTQMQTHYRTTRDYDLTRYGTVAGIACDSCQLVVAAAAAPRN